jgi:hypothetical protein
MTTAALPPAPRRYRYVHGTGKAEIVVWTWREDGTWRWSSTRTAAIVSGFARRVDALADAATFHGIRRSEMRARRED